MDARTIESGSPPAGSFRELWRVAVPLVLSSGSLSLMHVVDRVFLTWHSTEALAASLPAGMMHWTVISVLVGTVSYVNTFVAQYDGAGRPDRVVASVWQGVFLAAAGGIALLAVAPFSAPVFGLFGHEPEVQRLEAEYFSILCAGATPMAVSMALSCFYSGRGLTGTVMKVNFFAVGVNGLLDYCLIFGLGPLPEMGIRGAATATVLANLVSVATYAALIVRSRRQNGYEALKHRRFDRELFGRLVRYGFPTGLQYLAEIAGFTLFIFMVGMLGTRELAATNLAFTLNSLAYIPMFGFGTAVMILVGRRIGEGRPELAVRTTHLAFGLASAYMLAFAAVYVFLPELIIAPYAMNSSPEEFEPIRGLVVNLLRFVALYTFFDGMATVFGSAVRGAGDTRFSLIFTFLTAWLLMVLPTYLAWKLYGGSLTVSWAACTAYIVVVGVGFWVRFRHGAWKSMRVIEPAVPMEPLVAEPVVAPAEAVRSA